MEISKYWKINDLTNNIIHVYKEYHDNCTKVNEVFANWEQIITGCRFVSLLLLLLLLKLKYKINFLYIL